MYEEHYLNYFDDAAIAECVAEAKENGFTARAFAETGYIPTFLVSEPEVFYSCLETQEAAFGYDIFCRAYALYEENCPFAGTAFSVTRYSYGEVVQMHVIQLPPAKEGDFQQLAIILDLEKTELYFLAVQKGEAGQQPIYSFNIYNQTWTVEGDAPADDDQLLDACISLTVEKERPKYQYISKNCPLCGAAVRLGLTEEEMEEYNRTQSGDDIPALNAFEREFLITGMCPDCQCTVFKKEPPADLGRWQVG